MLDIRGIVTAMPPSKTPTSDTVELVGALRLPLGGVNGYKHVRGKQGRAKDLFQGTTPRKSRRTALFGTAREAAIALAELKKQQLDRVSSSAPNLGGLARSLLGGPEMHGAQQRRASRNYPVVDYRGVGCGVFQA